MTDVMQQGLAETRNGRSRPRFPRLPLFAALGLVGFALALAVFGKLTDIGTVRMQFGEPVAIRDIMIVNDAERAAIVDERSGQAIAEVQNEGFVFGVIRGLERVRLTRNVPADQPYRLIKWQNGWVSLSDTATGERIYLNAFGPDNVAAFEQYLYIERSDP